MFDVFLGERIKGDIWDDGNWRGILLSVDREDIKELFKLNNSSSSLDKIIKRPKIKKMIKHKDDEIKQFKDTDYSFIQGALIIGDHHLTVFSVNTDNKVLILHNKSGSFNFNFIGSNDFFGLTVELEQMIEEMSKVKRLPKIIGEMKSDSMQSFTLEDIKNITLEIAENGFIEVDKLFNALNII